ncbi:RNA pseudouridine synthase [Pseudoalteromonas sp. GCY]|uniref:TIGR01621 family pseudouridine synthase n=1 Tax=Pseudoalteromonas sp. GCY TaxID=2003316 RepID=UPI000BFEB084|nr:TIGR01621 family pseudouridine synthase [Pseudoalteromonas sp. GCY]PHI37623.1 RNA pseudouridine synthase [Pseudoalteromonas sp. GCY]QQQ68778.1 TIGR01621 family pseudouridine synthase [Pseudoalteromonas sp. GCY]
MEKLKLIADEVDYVVAYKPQSMSFHSEDGAGFVALLTKQLGYPLFPVHRLDKVTSGLILLAKSSEAAKQLTSLFSARKIDKFYLALVSAKPKKKQGWIKGDMAKSRRGTYKLVKTKLNPAVTRFYSCSVATNLRACIVKPFSGKTHQIRVALKSIGAPILGDLAYSGEPADRTYLHAFCLEFEWQGNHQHYQAAPEGDGAFGHLLAHEIFASWQNPSQLEW